jgi:hypothetical protein
MPMGLRRLRPPEWLKDLSLGLPKELLKERLTELRKVRPKERPKDSLLGLLEEVQKLQWAPSCHQD